MPAYNHFGNTPNSMGGAIKLANITPADGADLNDVVRLIYVGVSGNVATTDTQGNNVIHYNAPSGGYIGPFSVARVLATGTTATNLIGYV